MGDILKKLDKNNTIQKQELNKLLQGELDKETRPQSLDYTKYTKEAYYSLPTEGDKNDIRALLTSWKNDFKEVGQESETKVEVVTESTAKKVESVKTDVGPLRVVGMIEQADALVKILGITDNVEAKSIITDLKDTNIQSLLIIATDPTKKQSIMNFIENYKKKQSDTSLESKRVSFNEQDALKELGYSPNGSLWFGGEPQKVLKFLELSQTQQE